MRFMMDSTYLMCHHLDLVRHCPHQRNGNYHQSMTSTMMKFDHLNDDCQIHPTSQHHHCYLCFGRVQIHLVAILQWNHRHTMDMCIPVLNNEKNVWTKNPWWREIPTTHRRDIVYFSATFVTVESLWHLSNNTFSHFYFVFFFSLNQYFVYVHLNRF